MTFGAEIWGPPLIAAAGSTLASLGKGSNETKIERQKRKLVDQLLSSLSGNGPYSDIFSDDEAGFQKAFVDPAKAMFQNQIAPQIQQSYIASGQQRGTGLDDQLLRAGVDLDQMLNKQYAEYQGNALTRQQNAMNAILGAPRGAEKQPSLGQDIFSSLGGAITEPSYMKNAGSSINQTFGNTTAPNNVQTRAGFAPDWMDYQLNDKRWGQA